MNATPGRPERGASEEGHAWAFAGEFSGRGCETGAGGPQEGGLKSIRGATRQTNEPVGRPSQTATGRSSEDHYHD